MDTTTQPFLLYPQNERFVAGQRPHPSHLKESRITLTCSLVFLLPFVLIAVFLAVYGANTLWRQVLFSHSSAEIGGVVVDRYTKSDEGTNYFLLYRFTVGDRIIEQRQSVTQDIYDTYPLASAIPVIYAVSNPDYSYIDGTSRWGMDLFILGFGTCWILFVVAFAYATLNSTMRYARLRRSGLGPGPHPHHRLVRRDYTVELTAHFIAPDTQQPISSSRKYLCNHLKAIELPVPPRRWRFSISTPALDGTT